MGKGRGRGGSEYDEELSRSIFRVVLPVMICMALTIYLVHSFGNGGCQTNRVSQALELDDGSDAPRTVENDSRVRSQTMTFVFLGVFIGCMIVFTFVLVGLYKYHCERFILGWLFLATLLVFGFVGGQYLFKWSRSHCFPLDWVTLVYITANFAVVGMLAIFWKAPRLVNQAYLIVMSSLMAYIFRTLPPWATWVILGVLVLWDLFAVLSKYGPLRVLIEMARERGDPLPALVYDTNPASVGRDTSAQPAVIVPPKRTAEERAAAKASRRAAREAEAEALASSSAAAATADGVGEGSAADGPAALDGRIEAVANVAAVNVRPENEGTAAVNEDDLSTSVSRRGVGTMGRHLKLGLGDYVFYSVLVSAASQFGLVTAVTTFVSIAAGLVGTLFLVVVYRQALPALPISIVMGLATYFVTRYVIHPFAANLLPELLFH
ncbi:hypothetical protein MMPV_001291 [Pyropia vietnamensis]